MDSCICRSWPTNGGLKTAAGRSLARKRSLRTHRFYTVLLEEWAELGLGEFNILEEDIAGIVCILVVPSKCSCGGRLKIESDLLDSVKCRSVVVTYRCIDCGLESEFSFCLANVKGLPSKRQHHRRKPGRHRHRPCAVDSAELGDDSPAQGIG